MTAATATHPTSRRLAALELEAVAALSDPIGVLSVYADADPTLAGGPRPAWQVPVRTGLRRLVRAAERTRPRPEWKALQARVAELEPELESLLDPGLGHRGRALFAGVESGRVHRLELGAPFAPLVALDRHAVVLPLLAAAQDGAPAGVATVSWNRLEIGEWRFDSLQSLETVDLAEPGIRRSRPATNPAVPQPFPERDRFETAAGARVVARLRKAAAGLARHAEARRWDVLVVDGDRRLVDGLAGSLRNGAFRLVLSPRPLAGLPDAAAAERVGATVRGLRAERAAELLRALDASPASTRDPLVLARSLDEGRVEHLLVTVPSTPWPSPSVESLLRRALDTGAEVTAVAPDTGDLGRAGAAALLRW